MPETNYFTHELTLCPRSDPAGLKFPAKIAYWTLGNASKPTVLMPTCFGGTLAGTLDFLYHGISGASPAISESDYHILIVGLLGGSESSSPSNTPAPYDGPNFPRTTYEDNIRLQHALCESLGIRKLYAYIGFSMGGQQAYHAVVLYPDWVERACMLATSARTSAHNWSFLEGPKVALTSSIDFNGGIYTADTFPRIGCRAFSRVYSTWALSQAWFREKCWETLGFNNLEEYLDTNWNGQNRDANDQLLMAWTWQHGDVTDYHPEHAGDLAKTLKLVKARCFIMPSRTDLYFPPEDSVEEVKHLPESELLVIDSIWGHVAGGGGGTKDDNQFIAKQVERLLKTKVRESIE